MIPKIRPEQELKWYIVNLLESFNYLDTKMDHVTQKDLLHNICNLTKKIHNLPKNYNI